MTPMKPILAATFALLAIPAFAQTLPAIPDPDGNGTWSMEEMVAVFPTLTAETFAGIDTSTDGELDEAEVAAAVTSGILVVG